MDRVEIAHGAALGAHNDRLRLGAAREEPHTLEEVAGDFIQSQVFRWFLLFFFQKITFKVVTVKGV